MKKLFLERVTFLSLLAVFLLLPFAQVKVSFFGLPLYLPEIAIVAALFARVTPSSLAGLRGELFSLDKIFLGGAALFIFGATLAFFMNPFSLTGLGMLKSWFFFPLLAAFLVFGEARDPKKRRVFLFAWFGALAATALGSLSFFTEGALTYDGRLAGMYPSPNFLAIFIAPGVLLALYFLFSFSQTKEISLGLPQRVWLFVSLGGGALIIGSLFLTHSYGVWVATLAAGLLFLLGKFFLSGSQKKGVLFLGVVFILAGSFFFLERGSEKWQALVAFDERSSVASRLMIWQASGKILRDHALFGIGPGRFQTVYLEYQRYSPPYLEWAVPEPHSLYLAVLLGTGALGALGFLIFVGRYALLLTQSLSSRASSDEPYLPLLSLALLALFLTYGLTDTPYFKNDLALSFWLSLAIGFSGFSGLTKQKLP